MVILQKPGEMPIMAGEYVECDSSGNVVPSALRITMKLGVKPLPPTKKEGRMWKYVERIR